jgi:hypothetical protein
METLNREVQGKHKGLAHKGIDLGAEHADVGNRHTEVYIGKRRCKATANKRIGKNRQ